jgi:hypothetical protein
VGVVLSAGEPIKTPMKGAGAPNPYCASFTKGDNNAEDPMSVGIHVTFGRFRTIHLGDNTKNKEFELMCPNNRIGTVDLLLGLHHGQASSNSPVLVHAIRPRVGIMNERHAQGWRAGNDEDGVRVPGLRGFVADPLLAAERPGVHGAWRVHRKWSRSAGRGHADRHLDSAAARPAGPTRAGAQREVELFQVTAQEDGTFTVTNTRNNFSKTYRAGTGANATR